MRERGVAFQPEPGLTIAGTLCLPEDAAPDRRAPGIVLLGGTFGDTRDGDMAPERNPYARDVPRSGLLRKIAHSLAERGVATLRYDKRGCAPSGGSAAAADADSDFADARAALEHLRAQPEIDPARTGAAGHSAGAAHTARLVREARDVACAGLLGALYGSTEDLLRWNWGRMAAFWPRFSESQRAWLKEHRRREVVGAFRIDEFLAAARRGDPSIRLEAEGVACDFELVRISQGMRRLAERPRAAQFALRCPTLVLHGGEDMNVRVEDSFDTYRALREAGNESVELVIIPGLDHNFQPVAADPVERAWQRVSFESQAGPVSRAALSAAAGWASRVLAVREA